MEPCSGPYCVEADDIYRLRVITGRLKLSNTDIRECTLIIRGDKFWLICPNFVDGFGFESITIVTVCFPATKLGWNHSVLL